jgi:hypothetical protein
MVWRRGLCLGWDPVEGSCEHGNESSGSVKGGKCIVHLSDREDSVPWSCVICISDKSVCKAQSLQDRVTGYCLQKISVNGHCSMLKRKRLAWYLGKTNRCEVGIDLLLSEVGDILLLEKALSCWLLPQNNWLNETLKNIAFWDMTQYSPVEVHRSFGGTYCLCLQSRRQGRCQEGQMKHVPPFF